MTSPEVLPRICAALGLRRIEEEEDEREDDCHSKDQRQAAEMATAIEEEKEEEEKEKQEGRQAAPTKELETVELPDVLEAAVETWASTGVSLCLFEQESSS